MQTTALEIITDAYLTVGLLGSNEILTPDRAQFAFRQLNDMLDSWATDSLYVKEYTEKIVTIAAGDSFTVGPTGNVVTPLVPIDLERGSFFRYNGVDFEFLPITLEQYYSIPYKATASQFPQWVYYTAGVTVGTAKMYPILSQAAELHCVIQEPMTAFASQIAVTNLPLGYKDALIFSLAERLCFGKMQVPPDVMKAARAARGRIKDANGEVPITRLPGAVLPGYYGWGYRTV